MSSEPISGDPSPDSSGKAAAARQPDWADGLRQLYDSVVDEPLPDSFKDLLERLDEDAAPETGSDPARGQGAEGSDRGRS
jgi:hypothetical protein